jgi:hypothetical protein
MISRSAIITIKFVLFLYLFWYLEPLSAIAIFVNCKKRCTRLTAASDKAYQLHAHGRWFSSGNPASSTTTTGHHDMTEILLKVALNTKINIKSNQILS